MGGSRICPRAKYPVPNFCNFFFEHGPLTCLVPVPYIVAFVGYNPAAGTYEVPEFVPVRNTPCQTSAIFLRGSRICPRAKYPVPNFCNFFMRFPNLSQCEIPRAKLLQFFFFSMAHSHAWCQCHTLSLLSAATLPQVPMRFPNLSPCEIPRAKLLQFFYEVPEFVPPC